MVSWTTHYSFRKLSKGGGGGMMVKDVTKFHKRHLRDWGMFEYVCRVSYMILSFVGGNSKFRC